MRDVCTYVTASKEHLPADIIKHASVMYACQLAL